MLHISIKWFECVGNISSFVVVYKRSEAIIRFTPKCTPCQLNKKKRQNFSSWFDKNAESLWISRLCERENGKKSKFPRYKIIPVISNVHKFTERASIGKILKNHITCALKKKKLIDMFIYVHLKDFLFLEGSGSAKNLFECNILKNSRKIAFLMEPYFWSYVWKLYWEMRVKEKRESRILHKYGEEERCSILYLWTTTMLLKILNHLLVLRKRRKMSEIEIFFKN